MYLFCIPLIQKARFGTYNKFNPNLKNDTVFRIRILDTSVGGEHPYHFPIAISQLLTQSRKNVRRRKNLCYSAVTAIKFARGDKYRLACSSADGTLSVCALAPLPPSVSCTLRGHTAAVTGRC